MKYNENILFSVTDDETTEQSVACFVSAGEQLGALTVSEGKRQTRGRVGPWSRASHILVCVPKIWLPHNSKIGHASYSILWCSYPQCRWKGNEKEQEEGNLGMWLELLW